MKKAFAFLLVAAIMIPLLSFATAATESADSMNSHMVLHYSFNGENPLTNTGTLGSAGDLQYKNESNITHTASKGIVENTAANGGLYCPQSVVADICAGGVYNADTNPKGNGGAAFTMFLRFKLNSNLAVNTTNSQVNYSILEMRSFVRPAGNPAVTTRPLSILYCDKPTGTQDCINLSMANIANPTNASQNPNINLNFEDITSRYVNLALVVKDVGTAETHDYRLYAYLAHGSGSDAVWAMVVNNRIIGTGLAALNTNMWLMSDGSGDPAGIIYDDFRLYDTAYEMDDLTTIMQSGNFGRDAIACKGVQSRVDGDKYAIRFLGSVDALDYDTVGMEITATVGGKTSELVKAVATTVYSSVLADGAPVTADSNLCSYFSAFIVGDIPIGTAVTFRVRPYTVKGETILYSASTTVVAVDSTGNVTSVVVE